MATEEVRRDEAPDSVHRTVYVVRPDEQGVYTYDSCGIEHAWTTPLRLDIFSVEHPFIPSSVQRCIVRPNSVCEHGWFCTDNREVAVMVNELRGERSAVVAYLKGLADAAGQADAFWQGVASGNGYAAQMIERGLHRT